MTNEIQKQQQAGIVEQVVIGGDLAQLSSEQRMTYYNQVCESLGLNPYTKPFDYIKLNGKLTLYARKDAADQLRKRDTISIGKPDIQFEDGWIIVTVVAHTADGRTDSDVGVVSRKDMRGDFGNALMKAVTKAKRRVTLSICGLGWLDETEVDTIPSAQTVTVDTQTGEIVSPPPNSPNGAQRPQNQPTEATKPTVSAEPPTVTENECDAFVKWAREKNDQGGPASAAQYQYLSGTIDTITGQTTHKDILSLLLGKAISSDNLPSGAAAGALLDALLETRKNRETGEVEPNELYREKAVACISRLQDAVMAGKGQATLIEVPE